MQTLAVSLFAGILPCVMVAGFATAACNAIPDAALLTAGAPPTTVALTGIADPRRPQFGYKGALGRIDRVHVILGTTPAITVVPDGNCVNQDSQSVTAPPVEPIDGLVGLIYFRSTDGRRSVARGYASTGACGKLGAATGDALGLMECSPDATAVPIDSTKGLNLPLPTPGQLEARLGSTGASPSVRVVVMRPTERDLEEGKVAQLFERAATQPCRELCGESLKEIGLVCIDDIFAPTNAVAPQA